MPSRATLSTLRRFRASPLRNPLSRLRLVPLLAAWVSLAGCWELEQRVTVNPDGTARVRVVRELPLEALQMEMQGEVDPEEAARRQAAELIEAAQGVESWSDVEWSARDQVLHFSGTAYVPDLARFSLGDPSEDDETLASLDYRRDGDRALIEFGLLAEEGEEGDPLPELTEEEALALAEEIHGEVRQMRTVMAGMLIDMRERLVLRLPAEPVEVEGFERQEDGRYAATFEGAALLDAIGEILDEGPERLAETLRERGGQGQSREAVVGEVLVQRLEGFPARIALPGSGDPQFDYSAEVAAAREAFPALAQRLEPAEGPEWEEPAAQAGEAQAGGMGEVDPPPGRAAAAGGRPERAVVEGPPQAVYLEVSREGTSTFGDGTKLQITLPALTELDFIGLASDAPEGLTISDDRGRDLVAASREFFAGWQEANPNAFTSREATSWRLSSTDGEPSVPLVEIDLWAPPSPGTASLRVAGEVSVLTPPQATRTATVASARIEDGAVLDLAGEQVTLSRTGSGSDGQRAYHYYDVEGDVVIVAIRRAGEALWERSTGGTEVTLPQELPGDEPLEFTFGIPEVVRVPVDLSFGLGLDPLGGGGP